MGISNNNYYFHFDATRTFYNEFASKKCDLRSVVAKVGFIALPILCVLEALFLSILWILHQPRAKSTPPIAAPLPKIPDIIPNIIQNISLEDLVEKIVEQGEKKEEPKLIEDLKGDYFDANTGIWRIERLHAQIEKDVSRGNAIYLNGKRMATADEIFQIVGLDPTLKECALTSEQTEAAEFLTLFHQGIMGSAVVSLANLTEGKVTASNNIFVGVSHATEAQNAILHVISVVKEKQTPEEKIAYLHSLFHWLYKNSDVGKNMLRDRFNAMPFEAPKIYRSKEFAALLYHAFQEGALPGSTHQFFTPKSSFRIPYDIYPLRIHGVFERSKGQTLQNIIAEQDFAIVELNANEVARLPLLIRVNYDGKKAFTSWEIHPTIPSVTSETSP